MAISKAIGAGIAGLGLVGVGYAGLAGKDDTTRDESGEIVEAGELGAFRIRVGDCFLDSIDGQVEAVDAVPCDQPHMSEVFAAFNLVGDDDAAFPGDAAVTEQAEQGCYDRFQPFVGLDFESSVYGMGAIWPSAESWDGVDDREVLCTIANYDGTMKTGSAEGTRQ